MRQPADENVLHVLRMAARSERTRRRERGRERERERERNFNVNLATWYNRTASSGDNLTRSIEQRLRAAQAINKILIYCKMRYDNLHTTVCHPASQILGTFRRRLKTHLFAVSLT